MKHYIALCLVTALAACGGGGGGQPASTPQTYTVGGSITGLSAAGLVLAYGSDTAHPAAGATTFTLPTPLATGASYKVSVQAQPAGLACSIQNGSGSVGKAHVANLVVSCTPAAVPIGGALSGLRGQGLVLANGGDVVAVDAGATEFALPSRAAGSAYAVLVQTQPAGQYCTVTSGDGTVPAEGVADIRIACSGQVLYIASDVSTEVDALPLDASGWPQLSGMTHSTADWLPRRLAMSPDGKHLYACAGGTNRIDQYDIGDDGTLTPMAVPSLTAGGSPVGLAFTPDGRFAYTASSSGSPGSLWLFSVGSDGALSPLATPSLAVSFPVTSITISHDGKHLYATGHPSAAVFSIGDDGILTPLSTPVAVGGGPNAIALSPNGKFAYVVSNNPGDIREFAVQSDGTLLALGDVSANLLSPEDITFSRDGTVAYVPDWDNNVVLQYAVGADGLLTPMATPSVTVGDGPLSVALSADGTKAYVANARENTVAVFDVGADGMLAPASKQTFAVPQRPYHLLFR